MTAQIGIGVRVLAARAEDPPVPWKVLVDRFGLCRTRLWSLAIAAEGSFAASPLPLARIGDSLAATAALLADLAE